MSSIIEEFWIITVNGIPLFSYSPKSKLEFNLTGGFFSVLQTLSKDFLEETKGDYIDSIILGDFIYNFLYREAEELFFISKSKKKNKTKKIKSHLEKIASMFISKFLKNLQTFEGEIGVFQDFNEDIVNYFNPKMNKLKGIR